MPPRSLLHFRLLGERLLRRCLLITGLALGMLMAFSAWAMEDKRVLLHNSCDFPLVGFMIQEGDESWGQNWVRGEPLMPGDTFRMEPPGDGRCEVRVRVISEDRYFQDYLMDFCRAREVFIENNRISYR